MPYRFLPDLAPADVAFEAWGTTLEEMFICAADALINVMIEDPDSIDDRECKSITLEDTAEDMLLFQVLQELIFFKDARLLLLRIRDVRIDGANGRFRAVAKACGEQLDPEKHQLLVDVKAVTLHRFKVEHTDNRWNAVVVLDI